MTNNTKKIRIIIIDDHTLIGEAWKSMLETQPNYEVCGVYSNPETGVEKVKQLLPDLVLVDINMKPISGIEVTKLVKKFSPLTRVIAISLLTQPAIVKKIVKIGAKGYLTKSSDKSELFEAITRVLSGETYICREIKNILVQISFAEDMAHAKPDLNVLSQRELDIIKLLKEGNSSKEIAEKLFLSVRTIDVHRYNILKKLKLKNVTALINLVNEEGIFF